MKCPNCDEKELRPVLTTQGIAVDYCDSCKGMWLDRGELFHFARNPRLVAQKLDEAQKIQMPTAKLSPVTGKPMAEIAYPGGLRIDYCAQSGGLWFDAGEHKSLLEQEPNIRIVFDRHIVELPTEEKARGHWMRHPEARRQSKIKLLPLPNLFLRSAVTLAGLYAVLGAILIAAVEFAGMEAGVAVGIGVFVVVLQFLVGPFLMDLSLGWLYHMDWISPSELPGYLQQFVDRVCQAKQIRFPKFGIIKDGAPQAFTYGHTPNNARVVISRGILELLEPEEVEAVVAHELGHAIHWDMLLITIAQLAPLILYYVYRTLIRMRSSRRSSKGGGARVAIAIGAYILYIISEYVVLWFSRTREYHADRFAGEVTGNPSRLSSALMKIAYGLAGQEKTKEKSKESESRSLNLEAVGALGIFDTRVAQALAIASYSEGAAVTGDVDKSHLQGAMCWDLWNPWAKWYELNSTHPLVASRLRYLSDQAVYLGQEPYVVFDEVQPESYWDEFFTDLLVYLLPVAAAVWVVFSYSTVQLGGGTVGQNPMFPLALAVLGGAMLVRLLFSYKGGFFPDMSVSALLKRVKVSAVRPVPCTLRGIVIGRGVPGYIFSEDFVMKDETGIIFLDYRQPLAIWELLFGLLKAGEYQGREVIVQGWYRRSPIPYVEVKSIECDGKVRKSWVPILYRLSAIALMVIGVFWALRVGV